MKNKTPYQNFWKTSQVDRDPAILSNIENGFYYQSTELMRTEGRPDQIYFRVNGRFVSFKQANFMAVKDLRNIQYIQCTMMRADSSKTGLQFSNRMFELWEVKDGKIINIQPMDCLTAGSRVHGSKSYYGKSY